LKSRDQAWANQFAQTLVRWRVTPNAISLGSVLCSFITAVAFVFPQNAAGAEHAFLLVLAIAGMQSRLLCNLFDGMVAIEGGKKTKSGEIYNDLPDRIADAVVFISAGYAARRHPFGVEMGYLAAALAIFTAYVRMLGGAAGLRQSFIGPMAKQQRMAVFTVACALSIFETRFLAAGTTLWLALIIVNLGCVVTIWRRTRQIAHELEAQ
jgi:phosphatidylglycerophosphate synthase